MKRWGWSSTCGSSVEGGDMRRSKRRASGSVWAGEVTWQLPEPGHKAESIMPPKEATFGVSWKRHRER